MHSPCVECHGMYGWVSIRCGRGLLVGWCRSIVVFSIGRVLGGGGFTGKEPFKCCLVLLGG